MNRAFKLTIILLAVGFGLKGQSSVREFGKIDKAEIELKQYSHDKEAEALVLFDIGKSYFVQSENQFEVVYERTTRLKILSEAGVKYAEVSIPFYYEGNIFEKVIDIEANAYNHENGLTYKTALSSSAIFTEKLNNRWNVRKFAVPNVREGTIVEYRYKIVSQYLFNLRDWEFQWKIPVVYSEYEVRMIPFYEYAWLLQGANKFEEQLSYVDKKTSRHYGRIDFNDMVHKYVMKNIPAFRNEEFITSINDYIIKLDFQLSRVNNPYGEKFDVVTTWEGLNKELLSSTDFGKYIKSSEKLGKKIIEAEMLNIPDEDLRFDNIIEYVKRNYNWNNSNSKFASKSASKFVQEKHGNSADINLFTLGLLNAAGIAAQPVVISTRNHGKIKYDYPFSHFFNYVIILANVGGKQILTDATETMILNNRIPARCINEKGLIIQKNKVEWLALDASETSELKTDLRIMLLTDNTIMADIVVKATEFEAHRLRNMFSEKREIVHEKLESSGFEIIDSTIIFKNQQEKELPFMLSYSQSGKSEVINNNIYLTPMLNTVIKDNPLKQKERTYPVDLIYPVSNTFTSTITIPQGYKVVSTPSPLRISNQLFDLNYQVQEGEDSISITFSYYFKKAVYNAADYSKIQHYFGEIVKKGNERLILKNVVQP